MLTQRDTNREFVERYRLTDVVRRAQGTDELHPFVSFRLQETLTTRLRDQLVRQGVSPGDAQRQARQAAARVALPATRQMFQLSTEEFADPRLRNEAVGDILLQQLETSGQGGLLAGMDPGARRQFAEQTAERFYGAANRAIGTSMYRAFGNLQNVHRLTNATTLDEADRQQMQARFRTEMQEAMAPLGRGTLLSRAVDALQHARPDDPQGLTRIVAAAFGGVRHDDINRALMPALQRVQERRQAIEALQTRISQESDPSARAGLSSQLDVALREYRGQIGRLASLGEEHGLFAGDALGHEDLSRAMRTTGGLIAAQQDTTGLRGGFGGEVTAEEVAAVRRDRHGTRASATEAAAVILARRQNDLQRLRDHLSAETEVRELEARGQGGAALASARQRRDQTRDARLAGMFEAEVRAVRGMPGNQNLSDQAAGDLALGSLTRRSQEISPQALEAERAGLQVTTDAEARGLIRTNRRMTPLRAGDAEVQSILNENRGRVTEAEARELANSRLRARRLGISDAEVRALMGGNAGPTSELAAINLAFAERTARMYDVTDADRASYRERGLPPVTAEQRLRFREENADSRNATDAEVDRTMLDRLILSDRGRSQRARFGQFWADAQGAAFREQTDLAHQDVENVAHRLTATPHMAQRLGTRAVEMADTLRTGMQRLRELAMYHSSNDVARLVAGDYDLDLGRPGAAETAARVRAEVFDVQRQQRQVLQELAEQEGRPGRQFRLGDEADARRRLGLPADNLTPGQASLVRRRAQELGSEEAVRRTLGIAADEQNLSDLQRSQIAGLRFGAGNEEEVRLLLGTTHWDRLSETERQDATTRLRTGMGRDQALLLLRDDRGVPLAESARTRALSSEEEMRVQAAGVGLQTDAHARQLLGYGQGASLTEEMARRVRAARLGLGTEAWAREEQGLAASPLTPAQAARLHRERELSGNVEEAMRLLGIAPGAELSADQRRQLAGVAADVDVFRRLSPEQTSLLRSSQQREDRLGRLATQHGVTVAEMQAALRDGDTSNLALTRLTDPESERLRRSDREYRASQTRAARELGSVDNLRRQLTDLGEDTTDEGRNRRRTQLRQALTAAEGRLTAARGGMQGALNAVSEDSERRGVSAEDYLLNGRGRITGDTASLFNSLVAGRGADQGQIDHLAMTLGVTPDQLRGSAGLLTRLGRLQEQSNQQANMDPQEVVRRLYREYGFTPGDTPDATQQQLAGLMAGTAGRALGRRMLDSAQTLRSVAGRRPGGEAGLAGVDRLASDYFAAARETDPARRQQRLLELQRSYGFGLSHDRLTAEGSAQWRQFEQAVQFQQQTGLLALGRDGSEHRTRTSERALLDIYRAAVQGGATPAAGTPAGQQAANHITGELSIRLVGTEGTGSLTGYMNRGDAVAP
jgi:hypothetical protein